MVNVCWIALNGHFRNVNNILTLINEYQICPDYKQKHIFFIIVICIKCIIVILIHSGGKIYNIYIFVLLFSECFFSVLEALNAGP